MKKRSLIGALLLLTLAAWPALAALQAVGPVSGPHGFPLYYTDSNNLSLELCLDEGWCFFDPVDPTDPAQVELGVGGEVFWSLVDAVAPVAGVANGRAVLVLALEGTFGGPEAVINGQQIAFGRVRVRVDVPAPGTYTVLHPYGQLVFENVTVADGINYTADLGAANFFNVEAGFAGALQSDIDPFLTWPDYASNPALQVWAPVLDGEGNPVLDENDNPVLEQVAQYVGNLNLPHIITGSPVGQNFFRVIGPDEQIIAETELFGVMGKVYGGQAPLAHTYPDPPELNLAAAGPVNRLTDFGNDGSTANLDAILFPEGGFVSDGTTAGYPLGYPIWYQDQGGLRLTICQGGNPMCISDPVNANDPAQALLQTGGETFWWSADAAIEAAGVEALLVLGTEGTFGGAEALIDGQQIAFGRSRIRIDTPVAGTYTVIYPYGSKTFTNVPAGKDAIKFTADIGISDPSDPDYAMAGALFSEIGPNFLTWTTFDPTLANNDPLLVKQEPAIDPDGNPIRVEILDGEGNPTGVFEQVMNTIHYVGDPAIERPVTGGSYVPEVDEVVNYFRVIGPNGIDVRTTLFAISGRVFAPDTFRVFPLATVPVANPDTATTIATTPVAIAVLANDTLAGGPLPGGASVALATPPGNGSAVPNGAATSFTYTANAGFEGTDSFTYTVTLGDETSAPGIVTVTVLPPELVTVARAQLDLRKLRWDIRGDGNASAEGSTLTVRLGGATGPVLGTAIVSDGRWSLRATSTTAPPTGPVVIHVGSGATGANYGPFTVQVR